MLATVPPATATAAVHFLVCGEQNVLLSFAYIHKKTTS